jgi:hypothetical protein
MGNHQQKMYVDESSGNVQEILSDRSGTQINHYDEHDNMAP